MVNFRSILNEKKKRDTPGDFETRDGIVVLRCKVLSRSKSGQGWTIKTEPCVFCGLQHIHSMAYWFDEPNTRPVNTDMGHRAPHCVIPKAWRGRREGASDDQSWQTVKLPSGKVVKRDDGYYLKQADF